jgi:hypothetical protein
MKCVIRRHGLFLNLPGLWYIHGTWTPKLGLARVFRTRREALDYLATGDLPKSECELLPVTTTGGYVEPASEA